MAKPFFGFARAVGVTVALIAVAGSSVSASKLVRQKPLNALRIPQFVENLPDFSVLGRVNGDVPYRVRFEAFQQKILPSSFYATLAAPYSGGTAVYGYGIDQGTKHYPASPIKGLYPGYTVVVTRGHGAFADYRNNLSSNLARTLTIDQSIDWANPAHSPMSTRGMGNATPYLGAIPAVTHLHGAEDPSAFDGNPNSWFTPGVKARGPGFSTNVYGYPNTQEPTTLWFHDHTLGTTRLNVYAGMEAFYLIRGNGDDGVPGARKLPAGRQEVELVLQDRQFDTNGQLLFPDGYPSGLDGPLQNPKLHPYWMPEFFGDVITVNGKSWPKFNVAAKRYRLRLLDGANDRFFNLQFCVTTCETKAPFYVIGNDGGLLDKPVKIDHLLFSPGERYDIIVDFAAYRGKAITVRNDAVTPYPSKFAKFTPALQGQVMRFIVSPSAAADVSYNPASGAPLRGAGSSVAPGLAKIVRLPGTRGGLPLSSPIADGKKVQVYRQLTLNPIFGSGGCHWPGAGNGDVINTMLLNNTKFSAKATEKPRVGSTEVWDIIDLSNDDHPIHVHLVQFQVIGRIPFDLAAYGPAYYAAFGHGRCNPESGPPRPYNVPNSAGALGGNPDVTKFFLKRTLPYCMDDGTVDGTNGPARLEEGGWKDTVIASCGHVTRVVVRFTPQDLPAVANGRAIDYTGQNKFPFDPTQGPGYIWHCHFIDHEDNEMMRPMIVVK
ncbi:MAG TPA: multicopper oxidase domain-containing protein [Candidatus Rubrimentiphilum sp.]|nr:multicopper oxidase domain-containing protein [Candidatus Rubrimentiphilum sp.]